MKNLLDELEKLPREVVINFKRSGISKAIPIWLQNYIRQLDKAVESYGLTGNVSKCARQLQEHFPDLNFNTARNRVYDAINHFHLNNQVKNEAWDMFYADRLEDMSETAMDKGNITEARRCLERAHKLRTARDENAIDPSDLKIRELLIDPAINPEKLHLKEFDKNKLFKEAKDFINKLDIDSQNKAKLIIETSQAIDIDHEEIEE